MSITRRLFLRNSAVATAAGLTACTQAHAEPMTPHEQALWHVNQLEKLILDNGGVEPIILIMGTFGPNDHRSIGINANGGRMDRTGMFKGGEV